MNKGPLIGRGRTADIYAWGDDRVINLFNADCPLSWAQHEMEIAQIVEKAGLPAPHVEPELVQADGRAGIVYERLCGISMLRLLQSKPWKVAALGRLMADLHAAIHRCTTTQLSTHKSRLQRSIEQASPLPGMLRQAALKALAGLPEGQTLCHGDFHPDNIIMTERGPRVIDWMTAAQGDPLADVARTVMILRLGDAPSGVRGRWLISFLRDTFYASYINRYLYAGSIMRRDVDAWQLPTMAARLNEEIPAEHGRLLRLIEEALTEQETAGA